MNRTTEFIVDKITYNGNISSKYTISHLFDVVELSPHVPFATHGRLSKVFNYVTLPITPEWVTDRDDVLELRITDDPSADTVYYQTAIIKRQGADLILEFEYKKPVDIKQNNLAFIDSLLRTALKIPDNVTLPKFKPHGVFYIPNQRINIVLFLDMIMTNDKFNLLSVNEHDQTLKSITTLIYDDKNTTPLKRITFVITEQHVEGDPRIRINISTVTSTFNLSSVDAFKTYILSVFDEYNRSRETVKGIYSKLSSLFNPLLERLGMEESWTDSISDPRITKSKQIKDATKGQASRCSTTPNWFVTKQEALADADNDERKIFQFPKNDPAALWYACSGKKKTVTGAASIWPGLTSEPYVPCCYKKDQMTKKNTAYKTYYTSTDTQPPTTAPTRHKQQQAKKHGKKLYVREYGILPPLVNQIFFKFDNDTNHKYERLGVDPTEHSFLGSVTHGLRELGVLTDSDAVDKDILKHNWYLAKQERYANTKTQIINEIETDVDINNFAHIVESLYDCSVFIVNEKGLVYPISAKGFYTYENVNKRALLLYQNRLTQTDELLYELIVLRSTGTAYSLDYPPGLVEFLRASYTDYASIENLQTPIRTLLDPTRIFPTGWTPVFQKFDSFGKTRVIVFKHAAGKRVITECTPMAPIRNCDVFTRMTFANIVDDARQFVADLKISTNDQLTVDVRGQGGQSELRVTLLDSNTIFTMRLPSTYEGSVTISDPVTSIDRGVASSALTIFRKNKRVAHCIREYSKWLFAKSTHNGNIDKFVESTYAVIPGFVYRIPGIKFVDDDSSGIMRDGKVVVHDAETLKHVVFDLKISVKRNPGFLETYKKGDTIDNYYFDSHVYKTSDVYTLFKGVDFIAMYTSAYRETSVAIIKDYHRDPTPYYFHSPYFGDTVFMAFTVDNLDDAKRKCESWKRDILRSDREPVGVFLFTSESDIHPLYDSEKPTRVNIMVKRTLNIQSLIVESKFTVLLKM